MPGVKAGPVPQENQAFKIQRSYKKRNFIGNLDVCFCVTREAVACRRFPTKRLPDGRRLCDRHFIVWQKSDELERQTMSNMAVDNMMARRVKLLRFAQVPDRRVVNMPDEREQYEELDKRADATDDFTIKFKEELKNIDVRNLTGKHRSAFGIDIDYYTPEFKYDYMYMLMQAIRRSEAQINIYFQQLQRIENEEQELMQTIREGTMVGEKGIIIPRTPELKQIPECPATENWIMQPSKATSELSQWTHPSHEKSTETSFILLNFIITNRFEKKKKIVFNILYSAVFAVCFIKNNKQLHKENI